VGEVTVSTTLQLLEEARFILFEVAVDGKVELVSYGPLKAAGDAFGNHSYQ
jgi:hypothetical protein